MKRAVIVALLALCGVAGVRSQLRERDRVADRELQDAFERADRVVDFGVVLRTVRIDMKRGSYLIEGAPPMREVASRPFGGLYDTVKRRWIGPSRRPLTWFCSEEQHEIVVHAPTMPSGIWMAGGMGSGKTTAGAGVWLGLRVIEHATHRLKGAGVTAPTDKRMEEILKVILGPKDRRGRRNGGMWRSSWFTWREGERVAVMATGLPIDFRSAHIQSAEAGSPFQGQNWAFVLNDELQDYFRQDSDIRMRLRAGYRGRPQRFVTATAKNSSAYRTFKGKIDRSKYWAVRKVIGPNSPFIWPDYWTEVMGEMSRDEVDRKIFGNDGGSDRALYPSWSRAENLRPVPLLGFEDVTAEVLAGVGERFAVLVGHDPGTICDVSILLKAYKQRFAPPRKDGRPHRHVWWVVGEVTTYGTSTDRHVVDLLKILQERFHTNLLSRKGEKSAHLPRALARIDPSSRTGDDELRPHTSVRTIFNNAGIRALEAAYSSDRVDTIKVARVPKIAGIEMVDRLLCDPFGERRLFIDIDEKGDPVAPNLVRALESMERDERGRAETERKDEQDVSHWPAATRYALWELEQPRIHQPWAEQQS